MIFRDVVSYYRVWNGFAATVKTSDIPQLSYPGSQVRSVRRAFPASSEPVTVPGASPIKPAGLNRTPPVAVLDTGVDSAQLKDHADPGYDAVDRDRDPKPGSLNGRKETSGTALAGVVAGLGQRVLPIRIASFRAVGGQVEAQATTDDLLAGIEHAVDPNGDGDTSDHVPVVLVGVNAPYAGFTNSPEAEAVKGAEGLGTLIVAPAGNEGAAKPGSGTIGSPASARDSLAVGALAGDQPQPRTELTLDGEHIADAAVLAGDPPPNGQTAGPVSATDTAALGKSLTRIKGKVVIVEAGANPAAQAAAAAAVGARAVVIAKPGETAARSDQRRPLRHARDRRHRRRGHRAPQGQAGHRDRVRRHRARPHVRRAARRPHLAQHLAGPDRRRPAQARPGGQGQRAERRRRRRDRA